MWQWLRSDGDGGGGAWQVHEREYNISHASCICVVAGLLSMYKLLRTSFLLGEMLRGCQSPSIV